MTTAAPAVNTISVSGSVATFFVVPVVPDKGSVEHVFYYAQADGGQWEKISPKNLNAGYGGCGANQVMLYQPAIETVLKHTRLPADKLDRSVTLYAGVARTLSVSDDPLPSACLFDGNGFMVVPVAAHTARGLILVFSKQTSDASSAPVFELIATTDPEIKNGVGK